MLIARVCISSSIITTYKSSIESVFEEKLCPFDQRFQKYQHFLGRIVIVYVQGCGIVLEIKSPFLVRMNTTVCHHFQLSMSYQPLQFGNEYHMLGMPSHYQDSQHFLLPNEALSQSVQNAQFSTMQIITHKTLQQLPQLCLLDHPWHNSALQNFSLFLW